MPLVPEELLQKLQSRPGKNRHLMFFVRAHELSPRHSSLTMHSTNSSMSPRGGSKGFAKDDSVIFAHLEQVEVPSPPQPPLHRKSSCLSTTSSNVDSPQSAHFDPQPSTPNSRRSCLEEVITTAHEQASLSIDASGSSPYGFHPRLYRRRSGHVIQVLTGNGTLSKDGPLEPHSSRWHSDDACAESLNPEDEASKSTLKEAFLRNTSSTMNDVQHLLDACEHLASGSPTENTSHGLKKVFSAELS